MKKLSGFWHFREFLPFLGSVLFVTFSLKKFSYNSSELFAVSCGLVVGHFDGTIV